MRGRPAVRMALRIETLIYQSLGSEDVNRWALIAIFVLSQNLVMPHGSCSRLAGSMAPSPSTAADWSVCWRASMEGACDLPTSAEQPITRLTRRWEGSIRGLGPVMRQLLKIRYHAGRYCL